MPRQIESERRREARFPGQHHGVEALEAFAATPNLNRWYFDLLSDGEWGDVLEVGAGIGNMSVLFAEVTGDAPGSKLVVSDMDPPHVEALRKRFEKRPHIDVVRFTLGEAMPAVLAARQFDTIASLNVIEHVQDDQAAVVSLVERLRPGGRLLTYVPAADWAYGSLDQYLLHYRRYSTTSFRFLMEDAGLTVDRLHYVNALGLFGWLLNGLVLRRDTVSRRQSHVFDRFVPLLRRAERVAPPFGLGLVCHARKPR